MIEKESFEDVGNVRPAKIEKIAIVTSYVAAHAGGMTSILRIGTVLGKKWIFRNLYCVEWPEIKKN